jgi:drug/metabolite transporter (DMT)-like permease
MVMLVTALAAAVLYGAGAAVEQRQAAAAPRSSAGRPRLLFLLARQPLWLLGIAAQVGGFAAHAVALRSGPLATVQMLVAGELIVAVVIVRLWSGRPLGRATWAAALAVVLAVAAFLAVTSPGHGHQAGHPDYNVAAALGALVSGGAALVAAAAGLRAAGQRRAVLLAVAAGLADTCSAVVTMAFSHVAGHGLAALATSWPLYAVAVCGAGNVLLTQTAYQAGRPMVTLPVIAAVTPVTSVAIGIGLLGETPRTGVAAAVTAVLAVLVASVALACLARSAPHAEPFVSHAEPHARHPEPGAPHAEPRTPREQHRGTPHPRSLGPRAVPLARAAQAQDPRAAPEAVTISPALAIRLRAGRRMLPAHSRDDRP